MAEPNKPQAGLPPGDPLSWMQSTRKLLDTMARQGERRVARAPDAEHAFVILAQFGEFLVATGRVLIDLYDDEGCDLSKLPGPPPGDPGNTQPGAEDSPPTRA